MTAQRFPFEFDARYRWPARLFGVHPGSAEAVVTGERLLITFGPWRVESAISNIDGVEISGPYTILKTIGSAHLSFDDRGLTFATNPRQGVCVSFREPVRGLDPFGVIRHPGVTVTVADPRAFASALDESISALARPTGRPTRSPNTGANQGRETRR